MGLDEIWDAIVDAFWYIVSFEWIRDIWDTIVEGFSALSSIEDSPLTSVWFWAFYFTYMISMWYLPEKIGLQGYSLMEKIIGSIVFFIIDWFVIIKFRS